MGSSSLARLAGLLVGGYLAFSIAGCSDSGVDISATDILLAETAGGSASSTEEEVGDEAGRVTEPAAVGEPGLGDLEGNSSAGGQIPAETEQYSTPPSSPDLEMPPDSKPVNRIWGIETSSLLGEDRLESISGAGADWVRRNAVFWSRVEPVQGTRNWSVLSDLELELISASDQEIEIVLLVRSTPRWAQAVPGLTCGPIEPTALPTFADFLAELVSRYSQAPYNVRYFEIWNEPDVLADGRFIDPESPFGCWGDRQDPFYGGADYAEVLAAVYPQVKAANPMAQVLVGGLLLDCDPVNPPDLTGGGLKDCSSAKYLEGVLQAGGGEYFDGISFHAYDFYGGELGQYGNSNWGSSSKLTGPVLHAKTRYLRSLLNKYGFPDKFLINSESGLICGTTDGSEPVCQSADFNLTKAYYAAVAYAGAIADGLPANIWYSLRGWRASGLLDQDGQPQPVYDAFAFSAQELRDAEYISRITQYSGVSGYEFSESGKTIWLIWSAGGSVSVQLPEQPSAVLDVFGRFTSNDIVQQITAEPIYIEWDR